MSRTDNTGIRKRKDQAHYINTTPKEQTISYALCGTGYKELNEEHGAKTESTRYVNMSADSNSVNGYEWKVPFSADQIDSEPAIAFITDIAEMERTGQDAETDYVIVDLDEPIASKENTFRARHKKIAVAVAASEDTDGNMGKSGDFLGKSDVVEGEFNVTSSTFTPTVEVVTEP